MITRKSFYYIRHGQTDWNLAGKLQGNANIPLNETGIAQAQAARGKLAGQPITTICSSPLVRARKTADILNAALNCPIVEIDELHECDFGPYEGAVSPGWLADWLKGKTQGVPKEVEPYPAFMARAQRAINAALAHDGPVLIVAHGGIYQPINLLLPREQQWVLPNCLPVRHDPPRKNGAAWRKHCL